MKFIQNCVCYSFDIQFVSLCVLLVRLSIGAPCFCSLMASNAGAAVIPLWQSCETQQVDITSVKILHYICFHNVFNSFWTVIIRLSNTIQDESTIRITSVFIFLKLFSTLHTNGVRFHGETRMYLHVDSSGDACLLYLGGARFECRPVHLLYWLNFFICKTFETNYGIMPPIRQLSLSLHAFFNAVTSVPCFIFWGTGKVAKESINKYISHPGLRPIPFPVHWVPGIKLPGIEADNSPPSYAMLWIRGAVTPSPHTSLWLDA